MRYGKGRCVALLERHEWRNARGMDTGVIGRENCVVKVIKFTYRCTEYRGIMFMNTVKSLPF